MKEFLAPDFSLGQAQQLEDLSLLHFVSKKQINLFSKNLSLESKPCHLVTFGTRLL